jgi:hypothetical protein
LAIEREQDKVMMRTYHDHEDDEYLDVRSDMHHNNVFHGYNNGPDPRYYRNAPRSDEGHINTSSDECKTSCSMSRRSPDHSPKCNAAVGTTTVVHDNERDCFEDERDAPEEEDFDYREDEYYTTDEQESHWQGSYLTHHNHPVPAFGNGEGTHVFVPVDGPPHGYYHHDSHHPDGHYYHHQPRFPDPRYDIYHQHMYMDIISNSIHRIPSHLRNMHQLRSGMKSMSTIRDTTRMHSMLLCRNRSRMHHRRRRLRHRKMLIHQLELHASTGNAMFFVA